MLFARNEEINQWLEANPLVLGGGAIVLSLPLLALAIFSFVTGRAPSKWGREHRGTNAMVMGFVWLAAGGACMLFGMFKVVTGLMK
jgi:MFS family permease